MQGGGLAKAEMSLASVQGRQRLISGWGLAAFAIGSQAAAGGHGGDCGPMRQAPGQTRLPGASGGVEGATRRARCACRAATANTAP